MSQGVGSAGLGATCLLRGQGQAMRRHLWGQALPLPVQWPGLLKWALDNPQRRTGGAAVRPTSPTRTPQPLTYEDLWRPEMRQRRTCQPVAIVRAHYSPGGGSGMWGGARGELEEAEGPGSQGLGVSGVPSSGAGLPGGLLLACSPFLAPALSRS